VRALAALSLAALLLGCGRGAPPEEHARAVRKPGPVDTLIAAHTDRLEAWRGAWLKADPTFEWGLLEREGPEPFTLHDITPYNPRNPEERVRRIHYGIFSPDSTRFIDPDIARTLDVDELGHPHFTREAGSAPRLVDLGSHSALHLFDGAAMSGSEDAFWLDRLRFAIVGHSEVDSAGDTRVDLSFYDLGSGMQVVYRTSPVSRDAYGRYLGALDSLLIVRLTAPPRGPS
jgi:hypothetical protein